MHNFFKEGTSHSVLSAGCSLELVHQGKRVGRDLKVGVLLSGQGSLLFPKIEFFIKGDN